MSMSLKQQYALLKPDEVELLRSTHHPELYDLQRKDLVALQVRLRDLRGKAKTVTRHKQVKLAVNPSRVARHFPPARSNLRKESKSSRRH